MRNLLLFISLFFATLTAQLPDQIIRDGQYILSDLDGTLIDGFNGQYSPDLTESPCHDPLLQWLQLGGRVVAITGNDLGRTINRFFALIPAELRCNDQVIIVANGGSAFYGTDAQGNLEENVDYRKHALNGNPTVISSNKVDEIISNAAEIINSFFLQLQSNQTLYSQIPEKYKWLIDSAYKAPFSLETLLTLDTDQVPRIEKRCILNTEFVTQIALIGIPSDLKISTQGIDSDFEIVRANLTTEIALKGIDKSIPVYWLMKNPQYDFQPAKSVSIGDKPSGNDGPLMRLQETLQMPFISVSNTKEKLPDGVYRVGGNCTGTAKIINGLVQQALLLDANQTLIPVIPNKLLNVIENIN